LNDNDLTLLLGNKRRRESKYCFSKFCLIKSNLQCVRVSLNRFGNKFINYCTVTTKLWLFILLNANYLMITVLQITEYYLNITVNLNITQEIQCEGKLPTPILMFLL